MAESGPLTLPSPRRGEGFCASPSPRRREENPHRSRFFSLSPSGRGPG